MSFLYVNEDSAKIGVDENRCYVQTKDGVQQFFPIETIDSITIMGNAQLTTQCIRTCLMKGIPVSFFSKGGKYFGHMESTGHVNVERQRKQSELYGKQFALDLSKRIISAKLKNQAVVLRRYEKSAGIKDSEEIKRIANCRNSVASVLSNEELMGYEGFGAKAYFDGLSNVIDPNFKFKGRSRRPPLDEFNTMISLGYSILMNEIYGKIEAKGLNPYFGFLHRDKEKHPTLASDLMEEWRAIIVDATVMSMINGHEMEKDDFYFDSEEPGCYLKKEGLQKYLAKLERKFQTESKYLDSVNYAVNFREAIGIQVNNLVYAIENEDANLYKPLEIR